MIRHITGVHSKASVFLEQIWSLPLMFEKASFKLKTLKGYMNWPNINDTLSEEVYCAVYYSAVLLFKSNNFLLIKT